MHDYTVVLEEGIEVGISRVEQRNLLSRMTNQKATARFATNEGHNFVLQKIIIIKDNHTEDDSLTAEDTASIVAEETAVAVDPDAKDIALKELIAKSSCKHENQQMFVQTVSTKKGESQRYFPVCEFCGQRFRYVKADDLTDEIKADAKIWSEEG